MMSISTTLRSGVLLMHLDRLPAVGRAEDFHVVVLEHGRQREDVARVVVDDQHLAAAQHVVRAVQPLEHLPLRLRQVGDDAVQEQRGLVEQPLGRLHVLEHDALGDRPAAALPPRRVSSLPVNTTTGTSRSAARPASVRAARSRSCPAGAGRRTQQSNRAGRSSVQRLARRCRPPSISMSSCASSSTMLCALDVVVLDDQQPLACAARRSVLMRSNACSRSSVVAGLTRYENAPCDRPCWRSSSTESICTGMWRVAGSSFRLFSTVQPEHVGQEDVERDRGRQVLRAPAPAPSGRGWRRCP